MELFYLGLLMSVAFGVASAAERIGIPRVASYVLVGLLLSEPLMGGSIPGDAETWTDPITQVTLGVIAFLIGSEIDTPKLRENAKAIAGVVIGQTIGILIAVLLIFYLGSLAWPSLINSGDLLPLAAVLAVIGVATAPAATLAIIEDYHARGNMTAILLGVVVIDDALAVIFFTLVLGSIAAASNMPTIVDALGSVGISLMLGAVLGALLGWLGRFVHRSDLRLPMILAAILLNLGLAEQLDYPDLLSNIAMGFVAMRIFGPNESAWIEPMTHIRDTIFLLFFALAGTHFDPSVFLSALPLILLFCLARFLGKWSGAYFGASVAGACPQIRNWVGLAMMPQAGVAIGLALHASSNPGLEQMAQLLVNVVIGSTIVFELCGPAFTKLALQKAGELEFAKANQA